MYSVVLLMAFTGSAEAPALGHHDCNGGCLGSCFSGCGCSGSCYGCYGDCNGCCGGHFHSHHGCNGFCGGLQLGHHHDCCGCTGYSCCGCTGYSCCGCTGSSCCGCNGFCGGLLGKFGHHHDCCGCTGYSCCGCTGYSCCGCYGYSDCGCWGSPAPVMAPAAPVMTPAAPVAPPPPPDKGKKEEVSIAAPATIVVDLPADALLLIDDNATTSTSASRVFTSPALTPGKAFQYTLTAEIVRDGQKMTASERVTVRAGTETRVNLPASKFATASVAAK